MENVCSQRLTWFERGDIHKTAIITPFGLFEFVRMPFGLRNAAQTFQRFIDDVTRGLPFVYAYLDDLLIASSSAVEHEVHIRTLFDRLTKYGVVINTSKCQFGVSSLTFLGHLVDEHGIRPLSGRVQIITDFPEPASLRKLRDFLGLVNFYRRFVPDCADLLQPLTDMLQSKGKKNPPINLDATQRSAFGKVKQQLVDATLLVHPNVNAPLCLITDASDVGIGSVLQQQWCGIPLSFYSKRLQPAECRYSTFGRELLAVYLSIKHFQRMLEGHFFCVYTDHKPLTYALKSKPDCHSPREIRQLDLIAQFTSDIRHISGKRNTAADALSRLEVNALQADEIIDFDALAEPGYRRRTETTVGYISQAYPCSTTNIARYNCL